MVSPGELVMYMAQALIGLACWSIRSEINHVRELLTQRIEHVEERLDRHTVTRNPAAK